MAQKKTQQSDFRRGYLVALREMREAVDLNATGVFDRKALLDMLTVLRKHGGK